LFINEGDDSGEDLTVFRSLVPYVKQLPPTKILEHYQNNVLQSLASPSAPSSNSSGDSRGAEKV